MDTNLSFFKKMIIAMWKVDKYPLLINQQLSDTIKTFLIVSVFQIIAIAILITSFGNEVIKTKLDVYLDDIPEFKIIDSKLLLDIPETFLYNDPNNIIFLFADTHFNKIEIFEKYSEMISSKPLVIIISSDEFIISKNSRVYEYTYDNFEKLGIVNKDILLEKYVNVFKKEIVPIIYGCIVIVTTMLLIISKFLGGLILMPFVRFYAKKKNVEFSKIQGYNLVMYSGILATALSMILTAASIALPFWIVIKLALIFIFVHKGIDSYKKNKI